MTEGDSDLPPDERTYNEGGMAFRAGDYSRAIECFRRSLEIEEHFKSWEMIGSSLVALGDQQEALPCFRRAFEMNARSCKSGCLLAECMHTLGLPVDEIDAVLEKVLAVNPTYGPARQLREAIHRADESVIDCERCGKPHSIAEFEPSYAVPDPALEVPEDERDHRVMLGDDWCCVRDHDDTVRRYFLRVLMPFAVGGQDDDCCWGVWVEVSHESYQAVAAVWSDANQADLPPIPAQLSITADGYAPSGGLLGTVRLTGVDTLGVFELGPEQEHPLVREQRDGVSAERVVEWLHSLMGV